MNWLKQVPCQYLTQIWGNKLLFFKLNSVKSIGGGKGVVFKGFYITFPKQMEPSSFYEWQHYTFESIS